MSIDHLAFWIFVERCRFEVQGQDDVNFVNKQLLIECKQLTVWSCWVIFSIRCFRALGPIRGSFLWDSSGLFVSWMVRGTLKNQLQNYQIIGRKKISKYLSSGNRFPYPDSCLTTGFTTVVRNNRHRKVSATRL